MKQIYQNKNVIGADETGVGDYLTPLVAAAVFVPYQNINKLKYLGVRDSKLIRDKKIKLLAPEIVKLTKSNISFLTPSGYNKLNSTFNAHELKTILHIKNINKLAKKVVGLDLIILDQYVNENSFTKYKTKIINSFLDINEFNHQLIMVTKGETEHISVAAASILARNKLLELMALQEKK
jgi:ribonuclease HII